MRLRIGIKMKQSVTATCSLCKEMFAKERIIINKIKGNKANQIIQEFYKKLGCKIIPTHYGSDFIALHEVPGTTQHFKEYVEVKTGQSKQTKKQKQTMRNAIKNGHNYTVYHLSDAFLKVHLQNLGGLVK